MQLYITFVNLFFSLLRIFGEFLHLMQLRHVHTEVFRCLHTPKHRYL